MDLKKKKSVLKWKTEKLKENNIVEFFGSIWMLQFLK